MKAGFTLMELTIALGIMLLLSGTALAAFSGIQRRTLHHASLELQSTLRTAQRLALAEGRRHRVVINEYENWYELRTVLPHFQTELLRRVYFPEGVTITQFNRSHENLPRVDYLPRGTATTAFTIRLELGRYSQEMTGTVGGGRVALDPVVPR